MYLGEDRSQAASTHVIFVQRFAGKANLQGHELSVDYLNCPGQYVGAIIGEKGVNIRYIKAASCAHVEVIRYSRALRQPFTNLIPSY